MRLGNWKIKWEYLFLWARRVKSHGPVLCGFWVLPCGLVGSLQARLGLREGCWLVACVWRELVPLSRRMRWERRLSCAPEGSNAYLCCPRVMMLACIQGLSLKPLGSSGSNHVISVCALAQVRFLQGWYFAYLLWAQLKGLLSRRVFNCATVSVENRLFMLSFRTWE